MCGLAHDLFKGLFKGLKIFHLLPGCVLLLTPSMEAMDSGMPSLQHLMLEFDSQPMILCSCLSVNKGLNVWFFSGSSGHSSLIYTLRSTAKMPRAHPFCPSVVVSWPGSWFSKPRPVTHEAASEPHPDHLETPSPRPAVRAQLPTTCPSSVSLPSRWPYSLLPVYLALNF